MPPANFCTKCGARLNPQQRFCTSCGAAVPSAAPAPTAPMAAPTETSAPKKKSKAPAVIISILVVILLIVGIAVALCSASASNSNKGADDKAQTATTADSAESAPEPEPAPEAAQPDAGQAAEDEPIAEADQTETTPDTPGPTREETALYDKLTVLYDELGAFDQRISAAASDFNNFYASNDYALRAEYSADADALLYEIQEQYGELLGTNVPLNSVNAESYRALDTCYSDCVNRISVITEAWNISLSYDDPSYYRDEILEPIARDNDGTTNRYYADFQKNYPLAKPVEP